MFDPKKYQLDFPILARKIHDTKRLVYLDNAATSQKPKQVIHAISDYYQNHNANVHRGAHQLGDESTQLFHSSRKTIAEFFGADSTELIITRNTTEAINQVAYSWGYKNISKGDVIISTEMEHHSNLVPWQELAKRSGARLELIPVGKDGRLDLEQFQKQLKELGLKIKLVAFTHISNTLGTVNPVEEMVGMVRGAAPQAKILIDGAQAAPHLPLNFNKLDVDFYAVSAHKMLGPMGIGGLLVKKEIVKELQPWLFGGGMINEVAAAQTTFSHDLEERFTAGTPDVANQVGWAAACTYLSAIGMATLAKHDATLIQYALDKFSKIPQLQLIGPLDANDRVGSIAFIYKGVHAHDVGQILDAEGVAVRSGHHCTMPLHTKFNWPASIRVSFQLYNTTADIDATVAALAQVQKIFGV